jgi:hypothetical protein
MRRLFMPKRKKHHKSNKDTQTYNELTYNEAEEEEEHDDNVIGFHLLRDDIGVMFTIFEYIDLYTLLCFSFTCKQYYLNCFKHCLQLVIPEENSKLFSTSFIQHMVDRCINVTHIDFSTVAGCISRPLLKSIHFDHLNTMVLDGCFQIKVQTFLDIIPRCTSITHLSLRNCFGGVNDDVVSCIGSHCHKLQYINLSGCNRITNQSFNTRGKGLTPLVQHCHSLSQIIVSTDYGVRTTRLTQDGVRCIFKFCERTNASKLCISYLSEAL